MAEPQTIFLSAYRNFSIRYILYSDILRTLKKKDVRIVIFLQDNDLDYYRQKFEDMDVIVEPIFYNEALRQLKANPLSRFFVILRKCMSGGVAGYENTTDKVRLYMYGKEFSSNFKGLLEFQVIKLFAKTGRKMPVFRKAIIAVEGLLFPGNMYNAYFKKYNPEMLIVSSIGYMIDPYFMRAARRNKCKVVSIIHSWDNPTTKDYRGAKPDQVIVWNKIMKREVNLFHDIPEDKVFVGGIAHWDFYFNGSFKPKAKEEFLNYHGLSRERKIIFYGTSNCVLFRNTFDVVERLLQEIRKCGFIFPVQLLVRLHPTYLLKQKKQEGLVIDAYKDRIKNIEEKYGDLVSFNLPMMKVLNDDIDMPPEDMNNLAEILYYSDVLLTEYSTLMIEAAIFDLPVINVGLYNYRDTEKPVSYIENYTHIRRLLKQGASRNAYTFDQLFDYINLYLKDRSMERDKRKRLVEEEITTNRGCAGVKIGGYICELLNGKAKK